MKKEDKINKVFIVNNLKITEGIYISSNNRWSYCQLEDGSVNGYNPAIVFDDYIKATELLIAQLRDIIDTKLSNLTTNKDEKDV